MAFVTIHQTNKKIIRRTSFGSVCIVWSVPKDHPRITQIMLSRPGLSAEDHASQLFPDAVKSSCAEIDAIADSIKVCLEGEEVKFFLRDVDLSQCTKFQLSILRAQYAIPRGSVSTYGLIAAHVGAPGGARAVGNVMATNPFPLIIPCHRTVLSNLHIGGFQSGIKMKRALLEKEGIMVNDAGRVICRQLYYG